MSGKQYPKLISVTYLKSCFPAAKYGLPDTEEQLFLLFYAELSGGVLRHAGYGCGKSGNQRIFRSDFAILLYKKNNTAWKRWIRAGEKRSELAFLAVDFQVIAAF